MPISSTTGYQTTPNLKLTDSYRFLERKTCYNSLTNMVPKDTSFPHYIWPSYKVLISKYTNHSGRKLQNEQKPLSPSVLEQIAPGPRGELVQDYSSEMYSPHSWVRFWSTNSALKSAFLGTFKSAFAQKSAQNSAINSAIKSDFLWKVPKKVLFKVHQ